MSVKWLKRRNKASMIADADTNIVEKCAVYHVPCDAIRPNPMRSRNNFAEDKLIDLAYSIKRYGIIEPLCVTKTEFDDSYDYALIAGERRLRAAKLAGKTHVPCIILNVGESIAAELSLIENISRSDIDYFEVSAAIKRLSELYEESFEEICSRISIPQEDALKKLLLLEFDFEERQILINSGVSEDIALDIVRNTDNSNRKELVKRICSAHIERVDVDSVLHGASSEGNTISKTSAMPRDVSSVLRGIERRVKLLNRNKERATVEIDSTSNEIVITLRIKT